MKRWLAIYALLAGVCDTTTGLLLVAAPGFTLGLMGIADVPAEAVYLRFVGTFVGAVGLAYFYPFVLGREERIPRLAAVLEMTALVRLLVGSFVAASLLAGALEPAWASVAATDLGLAAFQIALLARGIPRKELVTDV